MRIVILPTEVEASNFAAEFITEFINNNKNPVVGLATGGSVVMTYEALISKHQLGQVSFQETTTFNLDEYLGLAPNHAQSYRSYMNRTLFEHIDIDPSKTYVPELSLIHI